ncbi:MAG TPA: DinB family protein [Anaerolineaceae bacterium]|nr:DinB family protein [Anaerolineaceae bacterium]
MKTDEIKLLYEYHYWANKRILETCARVRPEQYTAPTSMVGYSSLRGTLVHALDAEWSWRLILQGQRVTQDLATEADLPTLIDLEERWQAEEQETRAYLGSLNDEDLNGIVRYPVESGMIRERPLWHCLVHVVNHGTQHRSEAAALLTGYGQSPGDLDFTVFLNQYLHLPS